MGGGVVVCGKCRGGGDGAVRIVGKATRLSGPEVDRHFVFTCIRCHGSVEGWYLLSWKVDDDCVA